MTCFGGLCKVGREKLLGYLIGGESQESLQSQHEKWKCAV